MITRRTALRAGVAITGAVGTTGLVMPLWAREVAHAADLDLGTITKFATPMPVPKVLAPTSVSGTTSYYTVTMKEVEKEILPGKKTKVRTYNGEFPGPVIKATSGERVVVKQINNLAQPTSVHLHGAHVPEDSDGRPMDTIAPGGSKTYTYPNGQPNANMWFHDHAHHEESEHVYRGLSGTYLLTDDTEQKLALPDGPQDVPIALRDARFDDAGQMVYVMDDFLNRNTILVNGKPWPYFSVQQRRYRFRITNQTNVRFFNLKLSSGASFQIIGGDGGLLEKPFTTSEVHLSPGERADIVIDFTGLAIGTKIQVENTEGPGPVEHVGKVMEFRVTKLMDADVSEVPARLCTLPALPPATVNRTFDLRMDEDGSPDAKAYINEKLFDENRVDIEIPLGQTEIWTVTNVNKVAPHNFHMHLAMFRILERNGKPVTGLESGIKDTVSLKPGETVKLQATFSGYKGTYVYHCHLIDHAAMGMMGQMKII